MLRRANIASRGQLSCISILLFISVMNLNQIAITVFFFLFFFLMKILPTKAEIEISQ